VLGAGLSPSVTRWETRNTFSASSWPQASMTVPWHTTSLVVFRIKVWQIPRKLRLAEKRSIALAGFPANIL